MSNLLHLDTFERAVIRFEDHQFQTEIDLTEAELRVLSAQDKARTQQSRSAFDIISARFQFALQVKRKAF